MSQENLESSLQPSSEFISAVENGDLELVKAILTAIKEEDVKKIINAKLKNDNTLLHIASKGAIGNNDELLRTSSKKEIRAIDKSYAHIITLLLKAGANIGAKNKWQQTPIMQAFEFSRSVIIADALWAHHASLDGLNDKNQSLMHIATAGEVNTTDLVYFLVKCGFKNLNREDDTAMYPLHYLSAKPYFEGQAELLQFLIKRGAKVSQNDAFETPLHLIIAQENFGSNLFTLVKIFIYVAKKEYKAEAFNEIFRKRDAIGNTVLHRAVLMVIKYPLDKARFRIVELLLSFKADPYAENNAAQTPFTLSGECTALANLLNKSIKNNKNVYDITKEFSEANLKKKIINLMQLAHYYPLIYSKVKKDKNLTLFHSSYDQLSDRYNNVICYFLNKKYQESIPPIPFEILLRDIRIAKKTIYSYQMSELSDIPKDSLKNHTAFMATIFKIISEFFVVPRIFPDLQKLLMNNYQLSNEAIAIIQKDLAQYQENNQLKNLCENLLMTLEFIFRFLSNSEFKEKIFRKNPEFIEYIFHQIKLFKCDMEGLLIQDDIANLIMERKNVFDKIYSKLEGKKSISDADKYLIRSVTHLVLGNTQCVNVETLIAIKSQIEVLQNLDGSEENTILARNYLIEMQDSLLASEQKGNDEIIIQQLTGFLGNSEVRELFEQSSNNNNVWSDLKKNVNIVISSIQNPLTTCEDRLANKEFIYDVLRWFLDPYDNPEEFSGHNHFQFNYNNLLDNDLKFKFKNIIKYKEKFLEKLEFLMLFITSSTWKKTSDQFTTLLLPDSFNFNNSSNKVPIPQESKIEKTFSLLPQLNPLQ